MMGASRHRAVLLHLALAPASVFRWFAAGSSSAGWATFFLMGRLRLLSVAEADNMRASFFHGPSPAVAGPNSKGIHG